ncbi:MAG: hypothetical protein ABJL99_22790 [Aliishimia sp.]
MKMLTLAPLAFALSATLTLADPPKIEKVTAIELGGEWRFDVTISHGDTGWDDYADGWRVLDMDGAELGMRVLHHPHVNEQPFTRSLSGISIPSSVKQVQIEARESVGGWSGAILTVPLP